MFKVRHPALVLVLTMTSGCATIAHGPTQHISITSDPPNAACTLYRHGTKIAEIASTPGTVTVDRTWADVSVSCSKNGYRQTVAVNPSGFSPVAAGNIVSLFFPWNIAGLPVDFLTGAEHSYRSVVHVALSPDVLQDDQKQSAAPGSWP